MANDSDNAVKILIDFGLDPSKADEAVGLINKIKQEGQNMGMPEGWQGMKKYKNVLSQASHEAHGLHGHVRELSMLMRQGGPVASEFGHLLHLAFNPALLGGAALAGGMELYFHWLGKSLERQKEFNEEMQKHNLYVRELIKLQENANDLAIDHAKHLAEALVHARGLSAEIERSTALRKAFAETEKLNLDDIESSYKRSNTLMEGRIKLMEALGKITSAEGEQLKLIVEHRQKLQDIEDKIFDKQKSAKDAKGALEDYVGKLAGSGFRPSGNEQSGFRVSPEQVAAADDKVTMLKGQQDFYEGVTKNGDAELKRLNKELAETKTHQRLHGAEYDAASGKLKTTVDDEKISEINKQIQQQTNLIADANANLQSIENAAAEAADTAQVLHSANKTLSDLFTALSTATNAYKNQQQEGGKDTASENRRFATEATLENLKGETSIQLAQKAINAASELAGLKNTYGHTAEEYAASGTPAQKKYVQHLQDQVAALSNIETALGANGPAVTGLLNSILAHHDDLTQFCLRLQAQLNGIVSSGLK